MRTDGRTRHDEANNRFSQFFEGPYKARECMTTSINLVTSYGIRVEKKNQLDATEWFIALIICSTCFGHFYAHHQELETIYVLLPPMVCSALVAGCRGSGAGQQAMRPG